jgi:hypothetical protein
MTPPQEPSGQVHRENGLCKLFWASSKGAPCDRRRALERTAEAVFDAHVVYGKAALDGGIETYLVGRPVKPVYRIYN